MKIFTPIFPLLLAVPFLSPSLRASDYANGVIVLNENQYGKADSSINHLSLSADGQGVWDYGIFDAANPGKRLGATATSGGYTSDALIVVCKQASYAASASDGGGVVSCMDASSMVCRWQVESLGDPSFRAAGRGCLPLSDSKVYVSSSNGIWVVNAADGSVNGMIEGTENPYGVDDKPITDPTSSQYFGQCGSMVKVGSLVFAAHQELGVLVIDPSSDKLVKTISTESLYSGSGIGSVVAGSDGNVWLSLSDTKDGMGYSLPMLGCLNPSTFELTSVALPSGMYGPSTSWAAWNPDTFCASPQGYLFWTGGEDNWYANKLVYRFDIASSTTELLIDFDDDPDNWIVNTPSMRVDPASGNLWITLFKDYGSTDYSLRQLSPNGVAIQDYPMKKAYWFCGTILFPASEIAGVEEVMAPSVGSSSLVVNVANGSLTFSGVANDASVRITNLAGCQMLLIPSECGVAVTSASLPQGVYVASDGSSAVKFAIR